MQTLNAADILAVWESARGYHPVDQALALLAAADPQRSRDELAALPLGQRDAQLLALRQSLFGDRLPSRAHCPRCHEAVEFDLSCAALRAPMTTPAADRVLTLAGFELRLKPLDSYDLAAAAQARDIEQARHVLATRGVREAWREERRVAPADLPASVITAAAQALAEHDSQAELLIALTCPACAHAWQSPLDIAQLVWTEITAYAQRLLMDIHTLARAYGWRESDILALSPARRAAYLQMVAA